MESHCVAWAGLGDPILLLPGLERWDYRCLAPRQPFQEPLMRWLLWFGHSVKVVIQIIVPAMAITQLRWFNSRPSVLCVCVSLFFLFSSTPQPPSLSEPQAGPQPPKEFPASALPHQVHRDPFCRPLSPCPVPRGPCLVTL